MDPYHSLSIKKLSQKMIIVKCGGEGRALSGFESLTYSEPETKEASYCSPLWFLAEGTGLEPAGLSPYRISNAAP